MSASPGLLAAAVLAPAAVIGALVFLYVYDTNRGDYELQRAEIRRDKAEFDRDFAATLAAPGERRTELEKRAEQAGAELETIRAAQAAEQAERKAARDNLRRQLDEIFIEPTQEQKK